MTSHPPAQGTWLTGARLVDGTGRDPVDGLDVHVVDGRIETLGTAPAGASAIELDGFTLTPGLIDAHVHLGLSSPINAHVTHQLSAAEIAADIFTTTAQTLDAGFTTVRDTGGVDGGLVRAIASGRVRGPRVIPAGPIQCQTGGHGHFAPEWEPTQLWISHEIPGLCSVALLSDGAEQMRRNVRESFRRGARFIKMCVSGGVVSTHDDIADTQFTIEEIAVAVQEAEARGTYVTVHSHNNRGIRNAVLAGVKCIEHGSQLDEETAELMRQHGVAHVPTLTVIEQLIRDIAATGMSPVIAERAQLVRESQIEALKVSRAMGLTVGLGSDVLGPDQTCRSEELHIRSELESPMAALVAATGINAQILGIADDVGTVEVGKLADVVAWRHDPLEDPKVFTDQANAALVMQAGQVVKDIR